MLEDKPENEDRELETNDPSNKASDAATGGASPSGVPVSPNLNASGELPEGTIPEPEISAPTNVASNSAIIGDTRSAPVPIDSKASGNGSKNLSVVKRRATGPRTDPGKDRSKRNALKHGIFSSPILLGEENTKLYRSLLRELTECLDPQGALESILVEKLATNAWRHRRLLQAESAAIDKNKQEVLLEKQEQSERSMDWRFAWEETQAISDKKGLISRISEPGILGDCLERLSRLRGRIDQVDRSSEDVWDWVDLGRIYGARFAGRPGRDLYDVYLDCANVAHYSAQEVRAKGLTLTKDGGKKFLLELDKEIQRLEGLPKKPKPPDIELLGCKVPHTPELDRLLRYEASLERAFDRTLNQLERLQRRRKGEAVPAPISANVSLS